MNNYADPAVLADRLAIGDVLTTYCRGIDRCDLDILKTVFWPDGTSTYGAASQASYDWAAATVAGLSGMKRTAHSISNMLVQIDGDTATGETYCTAYHEINGPDGGLVEMVVGGRYLDRLEKRNGEWRILHRLYVMDWNRNVPSTCEWETGIYANLPNRGARKPNDPSYKQG